MSDFGCDAAFDMKTQYTGAGISKPDKVIVQLLVEVSHGAKDGLNNSPTAAVHGLVV